MSNTEGERKKNTQHNKHQTSNESRKVSFTIRVENKEIFICVIFIILQTIRNK